MARKKNYLNNKELYEEMKKSKEMDTLTDRALEMLMLMVNEQVKKFHYDNVSDKYDCISSAYEDIWRYWRGFKPERGYRPFAYFSSLIFNGLSKGYNELHPPKNKGTKIVNIEETGIFNI